MARKEGRDRQPVVFRGPPRRLVLLGAAPDTAELELETDEALGACMTDRQRAFRVARDRAGTVRKLKLKLDSATPPGDYQATLNSPQGPIPMEVHVEPVRRLSASPAGLTLSAKPRGKATSHLVLSNLGNVAVDVPERDTLGIYDDDGVENAFASLYRMESRDTLERIGQLLDRLQEGHGGLLKLRVVEGSGPLAPGERRAVRIEAQFPAQLKKGHGYHGVWDVGPLALAVTVSCSQ